MSDEAWTFTVVPTGPNYKVEILGTHEAMVVLEKELKTLDSEYGLEDYPSLLNLYNVLPSH